MANKTQQSVEWCDFYLENEANVEVETRHVKTGREWVIISIDR